jgi:SagB-type dehydrogenase family enzyme
MSDIGDRYQKETKYVREKMAGGELDWANKPETFKQYENPKAVVELSRPDAEGGKGLNEVLQNRRSRRNFTGEPINFQALSQLCWSMQGITAIAGKLPLRTAPSAGGLYPIETYVVINRVEDLEPGLFHLFLPDWELHALHLGEFGAVAANAALGQKVVRDSAVTFIFTAMAERSKWKYKQRAYRYVYLDAGHLGQNLSLGAEALGLGCCMIGAFYDDELNALLDVDGVEETAIYMGCVGPVKSR